MFRSKNIWTKKLSVANGGAEPVILYDAWHYRFTEMDLVIGWDRFLAVSSFSSSVYHMGFVSLYLST